MNKQSTKTWRFATPVMIICGLLASGASLSANSEGGGNSCSNRTLSGDYGFTIEGIVAPPGGTLLNGAGIQIRGVAVTHFDGKGNLTQVDHIVVNGMPPPMEWTPGTGTYTVNADCTGFAVIDTASSITGPLNLHLVLAKQGREIHFVVDTNAVTSIGLKID